MVLDTSVIVAILLREPRWEELAEKIEDADVVVVGAPTVLEAAMVLSSRMGQDARPVIDSFLRRVDAEVIAFHSEHADAAVTAYLRFGRGRHAAALNFGDCLSYAVASVAGMPLLFTGDDFRRTDVEVG